MAEREVEMVAERDALRKMWTQSESDLAALREDAERYRWIASKIETMDAEATVTVLAMFGVNFSTWLGVDDHIDAVRKEPTP